MKRSDFIRIGCAGWAQLEVGSGVFLGSSVYVRFQDNDGWLTITELYFNGRVTEGALRDLELPELERSVNAQDEIAEEIRSRLHWLGPNLWTAATFFAQGIDPSTLSEPPKPTNWVEESMAAQILFGPLRPKINRPGTGSINPYNSSFRPADIDCRLDIPSNRSALTYRKGHGYPDDFYKAVASLIRRLAALGEDYARKIADANGVKPGTVHRWAREARERGLLEAAGGQGKRASSYS
jgi:hypothetical protein